MAQRRVRPIQEEQSVEIDTKRKVVLPERPPNSMFIISIKKIFVYLSIVQTLLGLMEIVFCDMVASSSGGHYPGIGYILCLAFYQLVSLAICFACATNWCAPLLNPEDPQRYFVITCLSIASVLSCTFRAISQGSNYAKLLTLEACADSSLTRIVGNTSHYYRAYLCEIENASKSTCSCVNSDLQCLSYESVDSGTCANMIEVLPGQVYTTYFVAILCGVLCLLMSVLSAMSWRFNNIIKYEDDDERQDYQIQIIAINFLSALSVTSGAYFFFSSGAFDSIVKSIQRTAFIGMQSIGQPDAFSEVKHELLHSMEAMGQNGATDSTSFSIFSLSIIFIGALMSALAVFTIVKSVMKRHRNKGVLTADEASEQYMQNPGTSTVEIIRHLNVGKFDKKAAPAAAAPTSFLASSLAAVVNKVSSNDYYEEINRVSTLDILDSLQNPMRGGKNTKASSGTAAVTARAASIAAGLQPQASHFGSPASIPHGSSDITTELDTVDLIRRMGGGNKSLLVGGVPKTNTMDLMDDSRPSHNNNKVSPYLQQEKENSYYNNNLNTIDFIRNGEGALAAKNAAAAGGVPKKASSHPTTNNNTNSNTNNTNWFANISMQNPFDKK